MKNSPASTLWIIAVSLGIVLAVEVTFPGRAPAVGSPFLNVPSAVSAASAPEPIDVWNATALGRPLFSPDRRPAPPPAADTPQAVPAEMPRLAGIVITNQGRQAIFAAPSGSDHALIATEGSTIGPWKVQAIRAEDVQLTGPAGTRNIRPAYAEGSAQTGSLQPIEAAGLAQQRSLTNARPFASFNQPFGAPIIGNVPGMPGSKTSR